MEGKKSYSLTTRRFTLRCSHSEWLESTQLFYNQILLFYYKLFLDLAEADENISGRNSQQLLRELEKRTVVGRNREPVTNPLPWSRIPLYFRRAAANAGIAAGRSFLNRKEQKQHAESFNEAVTYYKGTYRDFDEKTITLKVWTGEAWTWLHCRLSGNQQSTQTTGSQSVNAQSGSLQQGWEVLSPSVVLKPNGIFLHVPVREKTENAGNAKIRMAEGTNICCIQFTNGDSIAVCAALDQENSLMTAKFLKGGNRYRHSCKRILERLEKSKDSTTGQERLMANRKYWLKLQNISISYSHQISRQIVDYAEKKNCGIIVLPKYDAQYKSVVMKTVGNWSPLHLSNRIRSQLSYKAWQRGILVLEADVSNTSNKCALCGSSIKKEGEEYCCENGHRGSRHVNTAVNLGRKCRESFEKYKNRQPVINSR